MQVIKDVKPDQQLVKVVYDELLELIGSEKADLAPPAKGKPQVILLAGLQGVGKTTACGKLAKYLSKEGKRVLMVSTDVYRPAAIDQLEMLAKQVDVSFLKLPATGSPPAMAKEALEKAVKEKYDVLLVDTAGRLQVDETMMTELQDIQARCCLMPCFLAWPASYPSVRLCSRAQNRVLALHWFSQPMREEQHGTCTPCSMLVVVYKRLAGWPDLLWYRARTSQADAHD